MWKNIPLLILSGLLGHHASPTTKRYHFVDQKMTWTDAQRHCREHFDDLATVDNPEELKQLQESRSGSDYDNESMWIGLYDDITIWHWSHGNQDYIVGQHYGNWMSQEPNNSEGKENCTEITTEGWNDLPCTTLASSVCIDDEGEYVYVREKLNWYKAREYCQSNYTELASVRDATENDKIFAMLESNAWIGLHRYPWSHWSDGSKATYWNWQIYQPDNYLKKQHCVHMNVTSGYFDDLECGSLHYVACQERQKQCSATFRLKISSEADMTDPKVQHKFVEQLSAKLAKEGVTGVKLRWVLKEEQDQQSQE